MMMQCPLWYRPRSTYCSRKEMGLRKWTPNAGKGRKDHFSSIHPIPAGVWQVPLILSSLSLIPQPLYNHLPRGLEELEEGQYWAWEAGRVGSWEGGPAALISLYQSILGLPSHISKTMSPTVFTFQILYFI